MSPSGTRRRFTAEEKAAALADLDKGMTLTEVAKKHGTSIGSVQNWKRARDGGGVRKARSGPKTAAQIEAELEALQAQLEAARKRERKESAGARIVGYCKTLDEKQVRQILSVYRPLGEAIEDLQS